MRALIQRVSRSSVTVDGSVVGAIENGLLVLAAVRIGDTPDDVEWIARKLTGLRIFTDDDGKMNRSILDVGGKVLLVSQFTLYGDVRKGRRPSFTDSAPPSDAVPLLHKLQSFIEAEGIAVETGKFGAHMDVELLNDGPVTLMLDSVDRGADSSGPAAGTAKAGAATDDAGDAPKPSAADHAGEDRVPSGRFRLLGSDSPLRTVRLVLASGSQRRRDLLRDLGLTFTVDIPSVDERANLPSDPDEHAATLAERKARAVSDKYGESVILAADTVVALDRLILGKPGDEAEAYGMLRLLRGKTHRVVTGVCVAHPGRDIYRTTTVSTSVRFRDLADEEIERYVATGEPFGKAGAYAIQGLGGLLVAGIDGDYTNVVGLPLGAVLDLLEKALGLRPVAPGS